MPTITDCHFLPPGVEKDSEVTLGFNGKEFHELLVTGHGQVRESGGTHRGSAACNEAAAAVCCPTAYPHYLLPCWPPSREDQRARYHFSLSYNQGWQYNQVVVSWGSWGKQTSMCLPEKQECVRRDSLPNATLWFLPVNTGEGEHDVRRSCIHPVVMWSIPSTALSNMVAASHTRSWALEMWRALSGGNAHQISNLSQNKKRSKLSH